MTPRHCRHFWMPCSEALRASFPRFADEARTFRVCVRCLCVEELEPVAVEGAEAPAPSGGAASGGEGSRAA